MTDDESLLAGVRRIMPELRAEEPAGAPEHIPGFTLQQRVGAGGMGVVYRAEQLSPPRTVAIKLIGPDCSPTALRRFDYEAEALGRLQHPGIAQIHATGTFESDDGPRPFLAMEFVEGLPVLDHARERQLDRDARLRLLIHVCRAVQHAHNKGVIHRDLKPSNILVDNSGQPKVLDFGVARLTDESKTGASLHTIPGQLLGTVPYMSPEQVRADPGAVDVRSDVYALGVLGFELLTGRRPHELTGKPITEALRVVAEVEPARLGDCDPSLRGDLEVVFSKALELDRTRRYRSADELAGDLERVLMHEPIHARPPTTIYQIAKFVRRHRVLVAAVAIAVASLLAATAISSWQMVRALRAERVADRERGEAEFEARLSEATNDYLRSILDSTAPPSEEGRPVTVLDALDHAARSLSRIEHPLVEAAVRASIGSTYTRLERLAEASEHLEVALALLLQHRESPHADIAHALNQLSILRSAQGDEEGAESFSRRALAMYHELHGAEHEKYARSLANLGTTLHRRFRASGDRSRLEEARDLVERAVALERDGQRQNWLASYLSSLGVIQKELGDCTVAETTLRASLTAFDASLYARDPTAAITRINLGQMLYERGEFHSAGELFAQAHDILRERYGEEHSATRAARGWRESAVTAAGRTPPR